MNDALDAARYRLLRSSAISSDIRPHASIAIYDNGEYLGVMTLFGTELDEFLDEKLSGVMSESLRQKYSSWVMMYKLARDGVAG